MTKTSGLGSELYVGGYAIGADSQALTGIHGGPSVWDNTDITQSAHNRDGLRLDGGMTVAVYFNPAVGREHDVLAPLPTADTVAMYVNGPSGVIGAPVAACTAKQINYDWNRGADGSLMGAVEVQANGFGLDWGLQATPGLRADTTATNGTGLDLGSVSPGAFGWQAFLVATAFTGTSCALKLQHATDNITFVDLPGGAFTAVAAAHAFQRLAAAGAAVNRYVRVVSSGTFSACSFAVAFHRNNVATVF